MKAHKNEAGMKPQYETRLALLEQSNVHFAETLKRIDNNIVMLHQHIAETVHNLTVRMDTKFDLMDKKFDQIDKRFDQVEKKFDHMDKRITSLNDKIDTNFKYIITAMLTLFVANGLMPAIAALIQKLIH